MLAPIKQEKLYKIIMQKIMDMIKEEKLRPGQRLPAERELSAALSVSRTSVRQAIIALSAEGLVEMRQGDGNYLTEQSTNTDVLQMFGRYLSSNQIEPGEILEMRIIIECESARLCALRAENAQIEKISNLLERKRISEKREASLKTMNNELHTAIAEGAHNKALLRFMEVLWKIMASNMWPLLKNESVNREKQIALHLDQHEVIVEAICARDSSAAYNAMKTHLTCIEHEMTILLENQ